jgi:hypothetical protein
MEQEQEVDEKICRSSWNMKVVGGLLYVHCFQEGVGEIGVVTSIKL